MFPKTMFRLGCEKELDDAYGVGDIRSMRVVCDSLRVSWKYNVVLLFKLKDASGVVDGDRVFGKNGIYYRVWKVD